MKKIVSSLLALSMILFMTCITVFADNETNVSEQCSFVYTDKTISSNYDIATVALDQYEPNDFDKPYILGGIKSKSKPIITVNASLSMIDGDILDGLIVVFFSNQTQDICRRHLCGEAGVPCGDALHDQGGHLLRVFRLLQPPVDGVGQADGVLGGSITRSVCRRRVLLRLPFHLRQ